MGSQPSVSLNALGLMSGSQVLNSFHAPLTLRAQPRGDVAAIRAIHVSALQTFEPVSVLIMVGPVDAERAVA